MLDTLRIFLLLFGAGGLGPMVTLIRVLPTAYICGKGREGLLKTEKEKDTTDRINAQKKGSPGASYPVSCLGAYSLTS